MASVVVIDEIETTLCASLQDFLGARRGDLRTLLRQFHNVLAKRISPMPRTVHLSADIQRHPLFDGEKKAIISRIITDIECGSDLSKYLSEKSDQLDLHDKCLAHFGAHHFHLGEIVESRGARRGRVRGTKHLLFVRIIESDAYLLDILGHEIRSGFLNLHLFRVMQRNWPESVESYRLPNALGLTRSYTDEEGAYLLEHDINLAVEPAPGQVYFLPGMGTTTAGTSCLVEERTDRTLNEMLSISEQIKQNPDLHADKIAKTTGIRYNTIRLRGGIADNALEIYDATSGFGFRI